MYPKNQFLDQESIESGHPPLLLIPEPALVDFSPAAAVADIAE
jgi:hypothetical protein